MEQEKPAGSGPFTFTDLKVVPLDEVGTLDGAGLAQWRIAAGAFSGSIVKTTAQFLAKLELDGKAADEEGEMRRWKVLRDGAHVYDVWIIGTGHGSVFAAGQRESAGVQVVKGVWKAMGDTPAAKQLALDLAASAPANLWRTS